MIELDADCCGIAGTYGLKKEKYEISMAVGERLFRDVQGLQVPISPPVTARRAAGRSRTGPGVDAVHPVELLYRAYGLDRPGTG